MAELFRNMAEYHCAKISILKKKEKREENKSLFFFSRKNCEYRLSNKQEKIITCTIFGK